MKRTLGNQVLNLKEIESTTKCLDSKVAIASRLVAIHLLKPILLEYGKSKAMNGTDFLKNFSWNFTR